jgi:hypothetical protein
MDFELFKCFGPFNWPIFWAYFKGLKPNVPHTWEEKRMLFFGLANVFE